MLSGKPTHRAVSLACALQNASPGAKPDASMEAIGVVLADIQEGLDLAAEAAEGAGRSARAADLREAAALICEALRLTAPCRTGAVPGSKRF